MRGIIVYLLAVCAERHGIRVHAFCAMSTHLHLVVTDPWGVLPKFLAQFHRLVGLCTKVLRKWEGATWDHEQTSVVRLETSEAVVDKIGYVLANPVTSGLVRHAREWPGAKSRVDELGKGRVRAARPRVYLDAERGRWPEAAELELTLPSEVRAREAAAWREAVKASVLEHEARGREEVVANGWKFLGARRAEAVSPYDRATSFEPLRGRRRYIPSGAVIPNTLHALRVVAQRTSSTLIPRNSAITSAVRAT